MIFYTIKRLGYLIPILLGVSFLTFVIVDLIPGDPALAILGPMANEDNLQELREEMNLNAPLLVRYADWLSHFMRGDWGNSISRERPVFDIVVERFGATLILAGAAFALCTILGLVAGVFMAVKQFSPSERCLSVVFMAGVSMPAFWLGLLLVLVFSVWLEWFPASGMFTLYGESTWWDLFHHLCLPAITLAIVAASLVARVMRAQMIDVLQQDFVRTAKAKGLTSQRIIWKHAFRNGIVAVIPLLGLQAGYVLGGAVYVETIFQWPGIGRMLVQAIQSRDIVLVQGGVLIVATSYVMINLFADLIQHALDPRTR